MLTVWNDRLLFLTVICCSFAIAEKRPQGRWVWVPISEAPEDKLPPADTPDFHPSNPEFQQNPNHNVNQQDSESNEPPVQKQANWAHHGPNFNPNNNVNQQGPVPEFRTTPNHNVNQQNSEPEESRNEPPVQQQANWAHHGPNFNPNHNVNQQDSEPEEPRNGPPVQHQSQNPNHNVNQQDSEPDESRNGPPIQHQPQNPHHTMNQQPPNFNPHHLQAQNAPNGWQNSGPPPNVQERPQAHQNAPNGWSRSENVPPQQENEQPRQPTEEQSGNEWTQPVFPFPRSEQPWNRPHLQAGLRPWQNQEQRPWNQQEQRPWNQQEQRPWSQQWQNDESNHRVPKWNQMEPPQRRPQRPSWHSEWSGFDEERPRIQFDPRNQAGQQPEEPTPNIHERYSEPLYESRRNN